MDIIDRIININSNINFYNFSVYEFEKKNKEKKLIMEFYLPLLNQSTKRNISAKTL